MSSCEEYSLSNLHCQCHVSLSVKTIDLVDHIVLFWKSDKDRGLQHKLECNIFTDIDILKQNNDNVLNNDNQIINSVRLLL